MSNLDPNVLSVREHAMEAYEDFAIQRGSDPLLLANAMETRQWLDEEIGFPVDDPEFVAAALMGAFSVYRKFEHVAQAEIDQFGHMTEVTESYGLMVVNGIIELGLLLKFSVTEESASV